MFSRTHWIMTTCLSALVLSACNSSSDSSSDSTTGNWINRYEMNGNVRSEAVSFVIGDTAYVGTGYDGSERLTDFWAFDAATNSWYQCASFPAKRATRLWLLLLPTKDM